jgi:hypothetical protein
MTVTLIIIGCTYGVLFALILLYGRVKKKVGENDAAIIKAAAEKKATLEEAISDNKRMSVRDKLKWLYKWASSDEV